MKSNARIWLPLVAAFLDAISVAVGVWLAYTIRFSDLVTVYIPIVTALPPLEWYVGLASAFMLFNLIALISGGMYRFPRQDNLFDELSLALKYYIFAFTLLLAALFFYRDASFSRLTMAILFFISGGCLLFMRTILRRVREKIYKLGIAVQRTAIVGDGNQAQLIIRHISQHPEFGLDVVGSISDSEHTEGEKKHLGKIIDAGQVIKDNVLDTLIISPAPGEEGMLTNLVKSCYGINVDFLYLPDIQPTNGRPKKVFDVGGVPLWTLRENPFEGWQGIAKRAFDVIISVLLMLVSFPLILLISVALKIDSVGPLIYRQRRIGLNGKEFDCLKFRSMRIDAEKVSGPVWAIKDDPRVTGVGRILRRWSMDELPQLWNVFRGEMSLVGPRPERPEFVKKFEKQIDGYHERHRVRAGLTGWAQVNGLRGDTPIEERTRYDRFYVENWSLQFDLKVLLLTAQAIIRGENSY